MFFRAEISPKEAFQLPNTLSLVFRGGRVHGRRATCIHRYTTLHFFCIFRRFDSEDDPVSLL